ncbi:penicillin-binding protein 1A [Leptolyngbya sp. 'hensonii']|uniref:transglycosylase domain-containing protein n=1 Tax=Leptolyngbya sp. 'hensonii' TaxID=1922337 RepID=UPI00209A738A|nr:penicillin-binding protein 1A [Leptolyngbya sp. 'hensonii']
MFWITITLGAGGAGAAAYIIWTLDQSLPDVSVVRTFVRDGTLTIKASDGKILQQRGPATREKLSVQKIPPTLIQAFLSVEDRRFYQHDGVDYYGVMRAIWSNVTARDVVEGGSTITQQVARIVFLDQERSIWRKLKEALLARRIEQNMSKERVLERYLNLVYLGSGAYGVADAAWVYFSKPVYKLTLPEMATIAGLPPAPTDYSPLVNPQAALERRNIVLQRMADEGFITQEQADQARQSPLGLKPSPPKRLEVEAPYFTTYVLQELPKYVSRDAIELGGLTIETSVQVKWQKLAEKVVKDAIELDGPGQGFAQAALVAIDPRTGEIKAMVGGIDYAKTQFNRVTQAQRQPGSTFKALVYTTAIATGMSPYDGYLDAPYVVDGYKPENASRKHYGWLSLREALTQSVNVIAVRILVDVGAETVIQVAKNMGIKSPLKPVYSLALGSSEVNLLEITSAYGTLATQGIHVEVHGIRRILNRRGEVLFDAKQSLKPKQAVDKGSAAIMTWMLEGVVQSGTGVNANLGDRAVAGKTGTSEEARDLWFIGYIPQMVTGVWLGNDDSSPTWGASSTAALVWYRFMAQVTKGMPVQKFPALPKLEGRKVSIKAKPMRGSVSVGKSSKSSGRGDSSPVNVKKAEPSRPYAPEKNTKGPSQLRDRTDEPAFSGNRSGRDTHEFNSAPTSPSPNNSIPPVVVPASPTPVDSSPTVPPPPVPPSPTLVEPLPPAPVPLSAPSPRESSNSPVKP